MGILHVPKLQKNLTRKQGASMTWEFQHYIFGTLAPFPAPIVALSRTWGNQIEPEPKGGLSPNTKRHAPPPAGLPGSHLKKLKTYKFKILKIKNVLENLFNVKI